jgi:hypothetical protein
VCAVRILCTLFLGALFSYTKYYLLRPPDRGAESAEECEGAGDDETTGGMLPPPPPWGHSLLMCNLER